MKAIKRLEIFLQEYSWKLRLTVFFLFIFWAGQTFFPLINTVKNNYHPNVVEVVKLTPENELEWSKQIREFARPIIEKAEAKGGNYSPWDYFGDMKAIKDFESQFPGPIRFYSGHDAIQKLNFLNMENQRKNRTPAEKVREARIHFGFERAVPDPPESTLSLLKEMSDAGVFRWIFNLYWRGLLLALLLYLIRMSDYYRGILETVLSDKKKLLLAIFFWPKFLFDYPEKVVRKIVVEAELRRLGVFWRKLDPRERKLVREIAGRGKAEYRKWIADYELKNAQRFKRSFEWALIGTVLILLSQTLAPINANADIRNSICIDQDDVYDQYDTRMNSPGDDSKRISADNTPVAWVEEIFTPLAICPARKLGILFEQIKLKEFAQGVFKIPVDGYLVKGLILQTK